VERKHIKFTQLLEHHLNESVKKNFDGTQMSPLLMRQIRDLIKEKIARVFTNSNYKLHDSSILWLTNQYFKTVKVKQGDEECEMIELIIINENKLSELPYNDIELMLNLYSGSSSPWAKELEEEYAARSKT
jgi:hypothetical protein